MCPGSSAVLVTMSLWCPDRPFVFSEHQFPHLLFFFKWGDNDSYTVGTHHLLEMDFSLRESCPQGPSNVQAFQEVSCPSLTPEVGL